MCRLKLESWDDVNRSFSFTGISGLLPVSNYRVTVSVTGDGTRSALKMTATYDADGVADADARSPGNRGAVRMFERFADPSLAGWRGGPANGCATRRRLDITRTQNIRELTQSPPVHTGGTGDTGIFVNRAWLPSWSIADLIAREHC
jgi:hypothetical protein